MSNEWYRRGLAQGCDEVPGWGVAAAVDHDAAIEAEIDWSALHLVVVDAFTSPSHWDRLGGATVAELIRLRLDSQTRVVAVLPEDRFGLARLRMAEAGVRHSVPRSALRSCADLRRMLDGSSLPAPDEAEFARRLGALGLTPRSRLNVGLRLAAEHGWCDELNVFTTLTRRQTITIRTKLTNAIGIEPEIVGSGAIVSRVLPSWRQICDVIYHGRGAHL